MIVSLEELSRIIAIVDGINDTDPKLLRYEFNGNLMQNESGLSNFDYARKLVYFIATKPTTLPQ